jgi:acyl carrier protein
MDKNVFLNEFSKLIDSEVEITFDTNLYTLSDYDSLTQMSICSWISDKFFISCSVSDIQDFQTIQDFYNYTNK